MMRSSKSIPGKASDAARELVSRAEQAMRDVENRRLTLESRDRSLHADKRQFEDFHFVSLRNPRSTQQFKEFIEKEEEERLEYEERGVILDEERKALRVLHTEVGERLRSLELAAASSAGLAPWDAVALEALRAWGDLPPSTPADQRLIKGSEVETLFRERLSMSRSMYYSEMRPMLLSYYLVPPRMRTFAGESGAAGKSMRFRTEEVEALITFIEAEAVTL